MRYRTIAYTIIVFTMIVTSSFSHSSIGMPTSEYPANINYPDTDFYNLNGIRTELKTSDTGNGVKILLTTSSKREVLMQCYSNHLSIEIPSRRLIDTLKECFRKTDQSLKECGFAIGKKGTISHIEISLASEFTRASRTKCVADITGKDDRVAFNVHSHPEHNRDHPGSAIASIYDLDVVGESFTQPCIVLGYTCGDNSLRGKYIGFHNRSDPSIACLSFDEFLSLIDTVEKDIQRRSGKIVD